MNIQSLFKVYFYPTIQILRDKPISKPTQHLLRLILSATNK